MPECARRELKEETEYDAPDLRFLMSMDRNYEDGAAFQVSHFWCRYDEKQSIVCHEGQGLAFVKRSDAEEYQIMNFLLEIWDAALAASSATSDVVIP